MDLKNPTQDGHSSALLICLLYYSQECDCGPHQQQKLWLPHLDGATQRCFMKRKTIKVCK